MIDAQGYRANVGIILANPRGQVLWARRIGQNAWQFPQGGIKHDESPEEALFRELYEELGLVEDHVEVVGCTGGWLRYTLPKRYIRRNCQPVCIGQKQVWFLLRLVGRETEVRLDACEHPEFDRWKWVDYWHPLREVIFFKRRVYRRALRELAPLLFGEVVAAQTQRCVEVMLGLAPGADAQRRGGAAAHARDDGVGHPAPIRGAPVRRGPTST